MSIALLPLLFLLLTSPLSQQQQYAMQNTTKILQNLRALMQNRLELPRLDAYIVPSDDAHGSEYISDHDKRREFVSGFTGSAGTAVVTLDKALLWTDGRYYQQANQQLDENWTLMKDGLPETPSIATWLATNLQKNSSVGVDAKLMSYRSWKPIEKELKQSECALLAIEENLVDEIWGAEQPAISSSAIISLDLKYAGQTVARKWQAVKTKLQEKRAHALVVSALDEIAWFLNLRGGDIEYNPVFFSYLIVTQQELQLFVNETRLPQDFDEHQRLNDVTISVHKYEQIGAAVQQLVSNSSEKIWISPTSSYYLNSLVPKQQRFQEITPIENLKAIKNNVEVQGFYNSHVRDGLALCQYFAWLENEVLSGNYVDELSGADKLEAFRAAQAHFMGLSFDTINASGPNGAIIHYSANKETNRQITSNDVYLCDSGAQYLDGTTDVTRTWHFGEPSDFQKQAYTRVLKGQLSFAATVFPKNIKGNVLDTIARKSLWDAGLDYRHGTGHGVGHYLNVHEGPMGVGFRPKPDDPGLKENMFISNEPGYYHEGEFGIRIEDIVQIVNATQSAHDFAGQGALTFKTITMCPKQTKLVDKTLLDEKELRQLNDYHAEVWATLSPILLKLKDTLTLNWLKKETLSI